MASFTTNLNLIKPAANDPFNVDNDNSNMQKIDDAYGKVAILTGTSDPTTSTVGTIGQFYLNTSTKTLYECMSVSGNVYTWAPVLKNWKLLQSYTTAGSYTFTTPSGITELGAFIIGGGGSGATVAFYYNNNANAAMGAGGGSGRTKSVILTGTLAASYPVVVGAGGVSVSISDGTNDNYSVSDSGRNGNSSSFNGVSASGGSAGQTGANLGADGAQGSSSQTTRMTNNMVTPAFGEYRSTSSGSYTQGQSHPIECTDPFSMKKIGIAGGFSYSPSPSVASISVEAAVTDDFGNTGSSGAALNTNGVSNVAATKGTSYGCGGGAATAVVNNYITTRSAAGCDGAVLIYGR